MFHSRWVLATLLAGCLLAGCSEDDPEPRIDSGTPTTSDTPVSPSVSASPTVTPTAPLGPEETVRAWVGAWNEALKAGDTSPLRQLETGDCRNCSSLSSVIEDVMAAGGSFSGGRWSIVTAKVVAISDRRVKVNVAMAVDEGSTVNSAGEGPVHFDADKRIVVYELEESTGSWLIDAIELLS